MGEVYRARDTQLGRDVAIKVLPPAFVGDRERLARFEREARVLAALNHPHIGAIYGIEPIDESRALILELVEGETLANRIAQGAGRRPVPIAEALRIAAQIAEGLEAAHDQGIVHRDLKPANIKISPAGIVKVLDYGLAKVGGPTGPLGADPSNSPTFTISGTQEGVLLGTAALRTVNQILRHLPSFSAVAIRAHHELDHQLHAPAAVYRESSGSHRANNPRAQMRPRAEPGNRCTLRPLSQPDTCQALGSFSSNPILNCR